MNIEPKQPTRKAPAEWFAGDVYIDAIHIRKPEPSRMACGCVTSPPAPVGSITSPTSSTGRSGSRRNRPKGTR